MGKDVKKAIRLLAIALLVGGISLVAARHLLVGLSLPLIERYVSVDHRITPMGEALLLKALTSWAVLAAMLGATVLFRKSATFEAWAADGPWGPKSRLPHRLFAWATAGGLVLTGIYSVLTPLRSSGHALRLWTLIYEEDYLLQSLTAVASLAAALLLAWAALSFMKRRPKEAPSARGDYWIAASFLALAAACFFFGMEEINWGQRIFGWSTPPFWAAINYQREINIHNLFNPFFYQLYLALAAILPLTALSVWLKPTRPRRWTGSLLLPQPSLLVLAAVIALWSIPPLGPEGELLEELMALFAVCYAVGIYKIDHSFRT